MLSAYRSRLYLLVVLILAGTSWAINSGDASANILFNRSVTISSGQPSVTATHRFKFDIPTAAPLGSIVLEYCSNSPSFFAACTPPPGLNLGAAVLASQAGNMGFSIDSANSTANKIVLTRAVAASVITANTYIFNNVVNPSSASPSVFVKLSTYATTDGSGTPTDTGAVAFAILNTFNVGAFVPPFLQLCVGVTVAPDCSSISGDSIDLGILSSTRANAGQSQFATATNDPSGYNIYSMGTTMTSGNNIIQPLSSPTPSFPGTAQFGINLRANLIPAIGQDNVGLGTAAPTPNYNLPNRFIFIPGDAIASSATTTNYNRMTVSYLVNVPSVQPPGVYATTITYVATVQF